MTPGVIFSWGIFASLRSFVSGKRLVPLLFYIGKRPVPLSFYFGKGQSHFCFKLGKEKLKFLCSLFSVGITFSNSKLCAVAS